MISLIMIILDISCFELELGVSLQIRSVWGIQDYIPLASNLLGVP